MNTTINTHATMMHFAIWLPDWNSLDSVRRAHSELEGAALVFFALLVVAEALAHLTDNKKRERVFDKIGIIFFAVAVLAEIAAYPYGQRNDTLSEQIIGSLGAKAVEAANKAVNALTDSGTALSQAREAEVRAGDALSKVNIVRGQADEISQRLAKQDLRSHLLASKGSRDKFRALIKPFRGQKFDIRYCPGNDNEIEFLSLNVMGTLAGAPTGWVMEDFSPALGCGLGLAVLIDKEAPKSTRQAAEALQRALFGAGLVASPKPAMIGTLERRPPKTPDERLLETSSPDAIMILVQAHP